MGDEKLTTVQIDQETERRLRLIAQTYERSKAAQVRFMVNAEYEKLAAVKLLPVASTEEGAQAL